MFREMRRKDRSLTLEETTEILADGTYGVLSLNGQAGDEYAYGVPVSYVYADGKIYIHCAQEGQKLVRMQNDNRVSFCVVGNTTVLSDLSEKFSMRYSSVIAFGQAQKVDGDEKIRALLCMIDKYSPSFKENGMAYIERAADKTTVVRIDIEHITGKARKA